MAVPSLPSVDFVCECLLYEDGKLFWKQRPEDHFANYKAFATWNAKWADKEAGSWANVGHAGRYYLVCMVRLRGRSYRRSILNWVVSHGEWPSLEVDHKDRDTTNDRIDNLRLATGTQNQANSSLRSNNRSGYKGISFYGPTKKWKATLQTNRVPIYLGYFDTPEEAHQAYMEAAREHFGEFACDGKPPCSPTPRQSRT